MRSENKKCEMDYLNRSLKSQMKEANRQGAKSVLIIGKEEIKKGKALLRDMEKAEQKEVEIEDLLNEISRYEK